MPVALKLYVRWVDAFNRRVGRIVMYMIFVMIGVLLYSSISRTVFDTPLNWVVETSQFMLASYYLLGGAYALQMGDHVRMDLFYGDWSATSKAAIDAATIFCLIFYLVVLFLGGISSTQYAIEYGQKNYTAWAPPLWPIKTIMTFGVFLMLLQAISALIKDIAILRGEAIE